MSASAQCCMQMLHADAEPAVNQDCADPCTHSGAEIRSFLAEAELRARRNSCGPEDACLG